MSALYPFRLIAEDRFPAPAGEPLPPPVRFLAVLRGLNLLFDQAPAVLCPPDGRTTSLLYRGAVYLWQDVAAAVGMAAAGDGGDLRFFGTTEARETAELTFRLTEAQLTVRRCSASGRTFDRLEGLWVQAEWPGRDAAERMAELAAALPRRPLCAAVDSRHRAALQDWRLLSPTKGSLFSYLAWEPEAPQTLLSALSWTQKGLLWRAFLSEGRQPAEFDWLWASYYTGGPLFLLEWELALRMALDELGFRVERADRRFSIMDRRGRERRFDFARGGPAEKVFLKLLFPLDAK